MHEALTALLEYGFGELDLNRVEARIPPVGGTHDHTGGVVDLIIRDRTGQRVGLSTSERKRSTVEEVLDGRAGFKAKWGEEPATTQFDLIEVHVCIGLRQGPAVAPVIPVVVPTRRCPERLVSKRLELLSIQSVNHVAAQGHTQAVASGEVFLDKAPTLVPRQLVFAIVE